MPSIFKSLPGIEVPAGSISGSLARMWDETAASGGAAPGVDDIKATQINLVIHLGFGTTLEDAQIQFQAALRFSQRYPSRVVVLCPLLTQVEQTEIRAKVYGECFLGKSKGDARCVEFVMLSYPQSVRQYLEDQVSICLSTDLPLYYWAHRFSSCANLDTYQYLLRKSKRVMFDSGIAPADALSYRWPRPEAVRDLVHARLLPVRQSLGQFFSAFSPAMLVAGLRGVTVAHAASVAPEGRVLLGWFRERLIQCDPAAAKLEYTVKPLPAGTAGSFDVVFDYANDQRFRWRGALAQGTARIDAAYGAEKISMPGAVSLLPPEAALAEAMFF